MLTPTDHHRNPQELRERQRENNRLRLRNCLNLAFILLALATMIVYLALKGEAAKTWAYGLCFAAIGVKMVEVTMRMIGKKR